MTFKILIFSLIFTLIAPSLANADTGIKMLAYKCDGTKGEFSFQPFIIWNKSNAYQGSKLEDPMKNPQQAVAGYIFFSPKAFHDNKIFKFECQFGNRYLKTFLDYNLLTIIDIENGKSWAKEIDLFTGIGSAWDVYGPLYELKSEAFGQWKECKGREDSKQKELSCLELK